MILSASNLKKEYGSNLIFDQVSFNVNKGDKVGIIGVNGAGKSTLLKVLTGQLPYDDGNFYIGEGVKIGYLKQQDNFQDEMTVEDAVEQVFEPIHALEEQMEKVHQQIADGHYENQQELEQLISKSDQLQRSYEDMGGHRYKSQKAGILKSMALDQGTLTKRIDMLSGGERTRLALACLLLEEPDILFLDEPTNHLDIGTLKWLEQYIKSYEGSVVLISHDRYFLDQCVNRIFELENKQLTVYNGNYTFYAREKKEKYLSHLKAYEKQQKEIKRQEDMIRRFKERGTEKLAKRAASREKQLSKVNAMEKPIANDKKMALKFKENFKSGNDVISGDNLSVAVGSGDRRRVLFSGLSFDIKKGEKIAVVGPNGAGKTTFLKMLTEVILPLDGTIKIGHNVEMAYYDQDQKLLEPEVSVMNQIHNQFRLYKDGEIRGILGRFLFDQDQVHMEAGKLSGGEKGRLALAKLMMSGANLLILDEPTNHLDIQSKEVIEDALLSYEGTVIVVSHDRYFLNRVPTRILELTEHGFNQYLGNYDYYVKKREALTSPKDYVRSLREISIGANGQGETDEEISSAERRRLQKEEEAKNRRLQREKDALETKIMECEEEISAIEERLCNPEVYSDQELSTKLAAELSQLKDSLEGLYDSWAEI